MDNFDRWLAHTLSARTMHTYDPILVLVRVPIHLVPDNISCSPTADGNFGKMVTVMSMDAKPYPMRRWSSSHLRETWRNIAMLYEDYVFITMDIAKELGVINVQS